MFVIYVERCFQDQGSSRSTNFYIPESNTRADFVEKLSNPKIPSKAISQGPREGVDLITIVSILKSSMCSDDQ